MRNKIILVGLLVAMLGASSVAYSPAVIGGVRNGTAIGMLLEGNPMSNMAFRLGFEANTSNSPGILFAGGKWDISNMMSNYPLYLSGGVVAYMGNTSEVGPYVSLIFGNFLNVSPLFLEVGIDVVNSGRLQIQMGYFF